MHSRDVRLSTDWLGIDIMSRINHTRDTLKLIDAGKKTRAELDKLALEYSTKPKMPWKSSSDAVFSVWPELGINSDFHKRKHQLPQLKILRGSSFIQEFEKSLREHIRELSRYERKLKQAKGIKETKAIPTHLNDMETNASLRDAFKLYYLNRLLQIAENQQLPEDRKAHEKIFSIINLFPSLTTLASEELASVERLMD